MNKRFIFLMLTATFVFSCVKPKGPGLAIVKTIDVTAIGASSAQVNGEVTEDGGAEVTQRGVCYSIFPTPTIQNNNVTTDGGTGNFTINLQGLTPSTRYFIRTFAVNEKGVSYGEELEFITGSPVNLPTVVTTNITNFTNNSANGGGNVTNSGGSAVSARGLVFNTSPSPNLNNTVVASGSGTGTFSAMLSNLTPGTRYYVRAFATNSSGTAYGNEVQFTTSGGGATLPVISTTAISNITMNSASSGGNISSDGGAPVTARGVCYSLAQNPTTSDLIVNSGTGTGTFSTNLSGLQPGKTYFVRAFATNSVGTAYGQEVSFATSGGGGNLPSLTTTAISQITNNSARSGGNVTSDGGSPISERGVVYAITTDPTTNDNKINSGTTGTGSFVVNISSLLANTTYYVRAYAINANGTAYGNVVQFTTTGGGSTIPTVTTAQITNITLNSARSGGDVTNDGGSPVTNRGICYSTNPTPKIEDNTVSSGSGTGTFTSNISGLNSGTKYYVRAFATNANGTAYGQELEFTTTGGGGGLATLTTTAASLITNSSARTGGSISANGGSNITERGVVYATTPNPTTNNTKINSGTTGIGTYIVNLTGLNPSTTYYVKAYAINNSGTAYGNEVSFVTTGASLPSVSTGNSSNITLNSATVSGNVTSDGGSTVTSRGICYNTMPNPTINNNVVNSGSGTGNFSSNLTGLSASTLYYARAFATNAVGTEYGDVITFTTNTPSGSGCQGLTTLSYNGHTYGLVEIGSQCWFRENLRTKSYRNGTAIPLVTNNNQWGTDQTGAYTHYDNNPSNESLHGLMYNWHAVNNPNQLCPAGWKVPSDQDMCTMEGFLGMNNPCSTENWRGTDQGTRLKDNVTWNGTNTTNFSMRASGNRNGNGSFGNINSNGYLWTSTPEGNDAFFRAFGGNRATVQRSKFAKSLGFSVRCVKE